MGNTNMYSIWKRKPALCINWTRLINRRLIARKSSRIWRLIFAIGLANSFRISFGRKPDRTSLFQHDGTGLAAVSPELESANDAAAALAKVYCRAVVFYVEFVPGSVNGNTS